MGVNIAAINMEWLVDYLEKNISEIKGDYITYLFENLESFFIKIKHKTAISKIADSLAKITLEIYLVQMVVIDLCAEHLAFPLSFVVAVVGIYVYAIIVNSISTQVRRIVEKIVIRKKKAKI